jgi:hypothetical protein
MIIRKWFGRFSKNTKQKHSGILPENRGNVQTIINAFSMAEDAILYSLTLSSLIKNKHIKSGDFRKGELPEFFRKINWDSTRKRFLSKLKACLWQFLVSRLLNVPKVILICQQASLLIRK